MSDQSRIAEIIDAAAACGRRVTGIEAAFGVGTGLVTDPYTGQPVPASVSNALDIGPGVVEVRWPTAWSIKWLSATVCEWSWSVPVDVSLLGPDLPTLLSRGVPLMTSFVEMFARYGQLCDPSGAPRCNSALITGGLPRLDPPRLEMTLTVTERLNFDLAPGGTL